jgi:RNA-directed DNA polymerase
MIGVVDKEMSDKTQISHGPRGGRDTKAPGFEEQQNHAAPENKRALTEKLMERVCEKDNLNKAYKRVKSNKGGAGIDDLSVSDLSNWIGENKEELIRSLLNGDYQPSPIRGVKIPKPNGGMRQLGIPTVVDRLVQQAILQILDPILDPDFSRSSYGFRKGKKAQDAIEQASKYVQDGYIYVVDMDLEKFFDRVNHDILMSRLSGKIKDKRLLRTIGRFLRAGLMEEGICRPRREGTPQGGPLSPLLSNFLLDELDKELERRGHKFCRFADDCNIYMRSEAAGERVKRSITKFLEDRLKLKVNESKSAVDLTGNRKFLGYTITSEGKVVIAKESISKFRDKVRRLTKRNRGKRLERVIAELNPQLRGWASYFYLMEYRRELQRLDEWIRRRLRCYRIKQCKKSYTLYKFLHGLGVPTERAWATAGMKSGWWSLSMTHACHEAMNLKWFSEQKLVSLFHQVEKLKCRRNRRDTRDVCPVV